MSGRYCRKHRERLARHGHVLKPSWRASEIAPFVRLAERYVRAALAESPKVSPSARQAVRSTVGAFTLMIARASPPVANLPRSPRERAKAILGRLHSKYVTSEDGGAPPARVRKLDPEGLAVKVAGVVAGLRLAHDCDPAPADHRFSLSRLARLFIGSLGDITGQSASPGWVRDEFNVWSSRPTNTD